MKISEIKLKKFKRFKGLTVSGLPETAKLVVLVGPNGCGKSSLFDAIYVNARRKFIAASDDPTYYNRMTGGLNEPDSGVNGIGITFHGIQHNEIVWQKAVYARSAYRNDPSFSIEQLSPVQSAFFEQRPARMIDNDQAAGANYRRLVSQALEGAFERMESSTTLGQFREEILAEIRNAVGSMFPDLTLNSLGSPLSGGATFRFNKGAVKRFTYENLSGGEKAAFDLILDLVVKSREYDDTVFCIDEPESHVGMGLHGQLLAALYGLIPDNCQLWIATHSIGMMRKAYDLYKAEPGKVVFLDFACRNFDEPQEIKPAEMDRALWERMHSVVLDDLADLLFPDVLYFCESVLHKGFDAYCYNTIFSSKHPEAKFVSVGSCSAVETLTVALRREMPGKGIFGVRDKDSQVEAEVAATQKKGVRVLSRICLEEYLLHDDALDALCRKHDLPAGSLDAMQQFRDAPNSKPKDAAKSIWKHVVNSRHGLPVGGDFEEFLKHLAELITPEMTVYRELERDIFGDGNAVE